MSAGSEQREARVAGGTGSAASEALPRIWSVVLRIEVVSIGWDAALVVAPALLAIGRSSAATPARRAWAVGLLLALVTANVLALADALRPVAAVARARQGGRDVTAETAEAAGRAFGRAPLVSGVVRLLGWLAFPIALGGAGAAAAGSLGLVSGLAWHALASAALRILVCDAQLAPARRALLPRLDGLALVAGRYRLQVVLATVAALGLGHAAFHLLATLLGQPPDLSGRLEIVFALGLGLTAPVWGASLVRRTRPVELYLDQAVRTPGGRGPSRDDPRAVAAFVAAQALPYRLAGYAAFAVLLALLAALVVGRQVAVLDLAAAARLLGVGAIVLTFAACFLGLALRRILQPLLRHLASRHTLPPGEVRAAPGLGGKLALAFGVLAVAPALAVLLASAGRASPALGGGGSYAPFAVVPVLLAALVLGLLFIRELLAPLHALESRSDELARGELARPLPPSGEADEVGRLAVAFEEMRRALRDRLRSTESINVDLEREVRRRTEALEQKNRELREALERLRRAQDDLVRSEKLASMGRLVSGIAHEINNPVNAVINTLGPLEEAVQGAGATEPAVATMLAVIKRGAARTKAIVQALHNYSRSEESVQREVNLGRCLEDCLDLLRHRLDGIEVVRAIDPDARILGYTGQIDQVLMNLITNAAQALQDDPGRGAGARRTIEVGARAEGDGVALWVKDDGPGIPPEILPRIFDPFFTTKDVGAGSGLGLSIVHGIVERHGGTITVDTRTGVGSTFRMRFPVPRRAQATA
jgi:signal transduction histidine kinase